MIQHSQKPLRVCFFGTYRANYERNRLMIDRLRLCGFEVITCHAPLWKGFEDRQKTASGEWKTPSFLLRVIKTYLKLLNEYRKVGNYDVMIIGYPGQLDIPLARFLSKIRGKPLIWDVLMSIYLIATERHLDEQSPITVKLIHLLEKISMRMPDLFIIDTPTYAEWYQKEYQIRGEKIRLLPLGADDRIFQPQRNPHKNDSHFLCLYYGSFIPNHGVSIIIQAAKYLENHPEINFLFIGEGPDRLNAEKMAQEYKLKNVSFMNWIEKDELIKKIADCDVVLGTFGNTPQALLTMQNKIHEGLAMAKPIINGDSPTMQAILKHREHIYLCERENPIALAEGILTLSEQPELCAKIASQGHAFYKKHLKFDVISEHLCKIVQSTIQNQC